MDKPHPTLAHLRSSEKLYPICLIVSMIIVFFSLLLASFIARWKSLYSLMFRSKPDQDVPLAHIRMLKGATGCALTFRCIVAEPRSDSDSGRQ